MVEATVSLEQVRNSTVSEAAFPPIQNLPPSNYQGKGISSKPVLIFFHSTILVACLEEVMQDLLALLDRAL